MRQWPGGKRRDVEELVKELKPGINKKPSENIAEGFLLYDREDYRRFLVAFFFFFFFAGIVHSSFIRVLL